jgi:hypothetical protein
MAHHSSGMPLVFVDCASHLRRSCRQVAEVAASRVAVQLGSAAGARSGSSRTRSRALARLVAMAVLPELELVAVCVHQPGSMACWFAHRANAASVQALSYAASTRGRPSQAVRTNSRSDANLSGFLNTRQPGGARSGVPDTIATGIFSKLGLLPRYDRTPVPVMRGITKSSSITVGGSFCSRNRMATSPSSATCTRNPFCANSSHSSMRTSGSSSTIKSVGGFEGRARMVATKDRSAMIEPLGRSRSVASETPTVFAEGEARALCRRWATPLMHLQICQAGVLVATSS